MAQIIPFQLEPEYSSDEERPKSIVEEEEEVLFPELGNLRLGNSLWCICTNCSEMPSEKECVCCKEMKNIYLMMEGLHCVTQHENFSAVCLNRDVLWTALASIHDRENAALPNRKNVSNRCFRYAAYRQFTWWAHGWLGKKIHRVIPACVVTRIRAVFPEPDGVYVGYKEDDDDDDENHDSEIQQAWRDFIHLCEV
ncbi:hypothetical protein ACROYT_G042714 [Oculina patagonica]